MIYIVGNSHVNVFSNSHPACRQAVSFKDGNYEVTTLPLGPNTAWNFTEKYLPVVTKIAETLPIPLGSKILLVVGEIDCRWHLPYQANLQKTSIFSIVDECMERFFPSFIRLRELGYQPCAWAVPPANNIPPNQDPDNPVYGTSIFRTVTIENWNYNLKTRCEKEGFEYYSIYEDLLDNTNGCIQPEYMADYCRLNHDTVYPLIRAELTK